MSPLADMALFLVGWTLLSIVVGTLLGRALHKINPTEER